MLRHIIINTFVSRTMDLSTSTHIFLNTKIFLCVLAFSAHVNVSAVGKLLPEWRWSETLFTSGDLCKRWCRNMLINVNSHYVSWCWSVWVCVSTLKHFTVLVTALAKSESEMLILLLDTWSFHFHNLKCEPMTSVEQCWHSLSLILVKQDFVCDGNVFAVFHRVSGLYSGPEFLITSARLWPKNIRAEWTR